MFINIYINFPYHHQIETVGIDRSVGIDDDD